MNKTLRIPVVGLAKFSKKEHCSIFENQLIDCYEDEFDISLYGTI
jgi:hypothetical protein